MKSIAKPIHRTVFLTGLVLVLVAAGLLAGCGPGQQTAEEAPEFSDPRISAPSPQEPGKEIGISIDVTSAGGVALDYAWSADGGEIIRGQNSPAITYRTPDESGVYFVRVTIRWRNNSVEKMTSIQVEASEEVAAASPPQTADSAGPTDTPTPTKTPTATPLPPQWDAEVSAAFTSIRRQPRPNMGSGHQPGPDRLAAALASTSMVATTVTAPCFRPLVMDITLSLAENCRSIGSPPAAFAFPGR